MALSFPPAWLAAAVLRRYYAAILRDQRSPMAAQERAFRRVRTAFSGTALARASGLDKTPDLRFFAAAVPARDYGWFEPYVVRSLDGGERDLLCHGVPAFVGLCTGTTGSNNKRIVHTQETLRSFAGFETALAAIIHCDYGVNPVVSDRRLWGTPPPPSTRQPSGVEVGYISNFFATRDRALVRKHTFPGPAIGRIADIEEKIRETGRVLRGRDLRIASAVPSYLVHLLEELRADLGVKDLSAVWPRLDVVIYSG